MLAIDLGHFTVVGKILFATFRLYSDNLLQATLEEDYESIIENVVNIVLPTTVKCPRSIANIVCVIYSNMMHKEYHLVFTFLARQHNGTVCKNISA